MRRIRRRTLAVGCTVTALFATSAAALPARSADDGDPWVVRSTTVELRREHFSYLCDRPEIGPPPEATLAVFPYDVTARVVEDHASNDGHGTHAWEGHEVGKPENQLHLQVSNACPKDPSYDPKQPIVLEGFAYLGERGAYAAHPDPDKPGVAVFEEWDLSKLPRQMGDDTADAPESPDSATPPAVPEQRGRKPDKSRPAVVDVLVLFTPTEATKARGDAQFKRSLESTGDILENRMNRGLSDSGVTARIDVVHVEELKKLKVSTKDEKDTSIMLDRLSSPANKQLGARADQLRKDHGADLVLLLADNGGSGLANRPDKPGSDTKDQGFAVEGVEAIYTDGVSHELGHNLGLDHDPWTLEHDQYGKGTPSPDYPYNQGWITKNQKYSTIMAYEWNCAAGTKYCTQVNQYANPRHSYDGQALGDYKTSDQTRVLKETAYQVGDYLPQKPRTRYALTLAASPKQGGSLRPLVWGPYKAGNDVQVKAYPAKGYAFAGWTFDGKPYTGKENPVRVSMSKAHSLTAAFQAVKSVCKLPVTGSFATKWRQTGGAGGRLKCPTTTERRAAKGGVYQRFQGGVLYWTRATGPHPVWGAFLRAYGAQKYERGRLGYPASDEQKVKGGVRQTFQGGGLFWNAKTRKVTVTHR